MSQQPSHSEVQTRPGPFPRKGVRHYNTTKEINSEYFKNSDLISTHAENNPPYSCDLTDKPHKNLPVRSRNNSTTLDYNILSVNLPTVIMTKEMSHRKQTFNVFFKRNLYQDIDSEVKKDFHVIDRNSSLGQIQNLRNIAKKRCQKKHNSGVMFINELWDKRHYRALMKKSGIQSHKDQLQKIALAPLQDRHQLFMDFFDKNQAVESKDNKNDYPIATSREKYSEEDENQQLLRHISRKNSLDVQIERVNQQRLKKMAHRNTEDCEDLGKDDILQSYYFPSLDKIPSKGQVFESSKSKLLIKAPPKKSEISKSLAIDRWDSLKRAPADEKRMSECDISNHVSYGNKENEGLFDEISEKLPSTARDFGNDRKNEEWELFNAPNTSREIKGENILPKLRPKGKQRTQKLQEYLNGIIASCKELDDGGHLQRKIEKTCEKIGSHRQIQSHHVKKIMREEQTTSSHRLILRGKNE